MPTIRFGEAELECPAGANLRMALIRARLPLYTTAARALHCRGRGSCGTCAVGIEGAVSAVSEPTPVEAKRLARVPHDPQKGLRLACQVRVLGDVTVTKYPGFFGQRTDEAD